MDCTALMLLLSLLLVCSHSKLYVQRYVLNGGPFAGIPAVVGRGLRAVLIPVDAIDVPGSHLDALVIRGAVVVLFSGFKQKSQKRKNEALAEMYT